MSDLIKLATKRERERERERSLRLGERERGREREREWCEASFGIKGKAKLELGNTEQRFWK